MATFHAGHKAGVHTSRVAVRTTGTFDIATGRGVVQACTTGMSGSCDAAHGLFLSCFAGVRFLWPEGRSVHGDC
ncbi:hypothetical protein [Nonomuraea sp. SYSU D8015]|uniref:hypothetical protein n=1 Tax=Nonomuraea sp. SYSU D8015 TaxID=2593644 RepID=UPI001660885F|nr:hypothetical protein [Nonomuraea sp. SYSU D8015]